MTIQAHSLDSVVSKPPMPPQPCGRPGREPDAGRLAEGAGGPCSESVGTSCGPQTEALAAAVRRVRDSDFDCVHVSASQTEKAARMAAVVLPLARHGMARDIRRRGFAECRAAVRSLAQPAERYRTILSRKHRCVWYRIPKAASTSVLAGMLASDPECEVFQTTSAEFYALRPEARDWFTFAIVRHPFDRALSFWSEVHFSSKPHRYSVRASHQRQKRAAIFKRCYGLAETLDFDSYCAWLRTPYGADAYTDRHVASQSKPIREASGSRGRPPDFIGRVENLEADWGRIAAEAGFACRTLPMLHSLVEWEAAPQDVEIARASRAAMLTSRNKSLLADRYAEDLELGGYSPTSPGTIVSAPAVRCLERAGASDSASGRGAIGASGRAERPGTGP